MYGVTIIEGYCLGFPITYVKSNKILLFFIMLISVEVVIYLCTT